MSIRNAVKSYVKEFYEITYNPKEKKIILHDELETYGSRNYIDIGRVGRIKITLCWGKIEEVTGIQYHHKEFQSELSKLFFELVTEKKSKDFFNILLNENISVNLEFKELLNEFPLLND
jgi:hypothetical protein